MYNNPFLYQSIRPGLFSRIFRAGAISRINWANLLTNAQKSLGIINQAIPLVYQVKPIISNAKTMFKIADAMKDDGNKKTTSTNISSKQETISPSTDNKPVFYI